MPSVYHIPHLLRISRTSLSHLSHISLTSRISFSLLFFAFGYHDLEPPGTPLVDDPLSPLTISLASLHLLPNRVWSAASSASIPQSDEHCEYSVRFVSLPEPRHCPITHLFGPSRLFSGRLLVLMSWPSVACPGPSPLQPFDMLTAVEWSPLPSDRLP